MKHVRISVHFSAQILFSFIFTQASLSDGVTNVLSFDYFSQAVFLQGLPEQNLENITLENIDIEADNGFACIDANSISVKGMRLIVKESPSLYFLNSQNVDIEKLNLPDIINPSIVVKGEKSKHITIRSVNSGNEKRAVVGDDADSGTINIF